MKNGFLFLVVLCLWLLGTIGGFGYLVYIHQWPIAVGVAANGVMAFPVVRKWYKKVTG